MRPHKRIRSLATLQMCPWAISLPARAVFTAIVSNQPSHGLADLLFCVMYSLASYFGAVTAPSW